MIEIIHPRMQFPTTTTNTTAITIETVEIQNNHTKWNNLIDKYKHSHLPNKDHN